MSLFMSLRKHLKLPSYGLLSMKIYNRNCKEHLMLFPKDRRKYKFLFLICIYFIVKYFPANKNSNLEKVFKLYIFKIISGFL